MKTDALFLLAALSAMPLSCTKAPPAPAEQAKIDYLKSAQARLGEWQTLLDNLRRNRDMHAVHSDLYRKRNETVQFLEKEVSEAQNRYDEARSQNTAESQARLEAKLTELKEGYFRPQQGE